MGGAVAVRIAASPGVEAVLGLAPWLPDKLDVSPLRGKRLDVLHGSLDRNLPAVPGVSAQSSRAGWERALAAGGDGTYTLIRGALHAIALRSRGGAPVPLPRARTWARLAAERVQSFAAV